MEASATDGSDSSPHCRLCHMEDSRSNLVRPCRCKGTMLLAHESCLIQWTIRTESLACPVCKYRYKISRVYVVTGASLPQGTVDNDDDDDDESASGTEQDERRIEGSDADALGNELQHRVSPFLSPTASPNRNAAEHPVDDDISSLPPLNDAPVSASTHAKRDKKPKGPRKGILRRLLPTWASLKSRGHFCYLLAHHLIFSVLKLRFFVVIAMWFLLFPYITFVAYMVVMKSFIAEPWLQSFAESYTWADAVAVGNAVVILMLVFVCLFEGVMFYMRQNVGSIPCLKDYAVMKTAILEQHAEMLQEVNERLRLHVQRESEIRDLLREYTEGRRALVIAELKRTQAERLKERLDGILVSKSARAEYRRLIVERRRRGEETDADRLLGEDFLAETESELEEEGTVGGDTGMVDAPPSQAVGLTSTSDEEAVSGSPDEQLDAVVAPAKSNQAEDKDVPKPEQRTPSLEEATTSDDAAPLHAPDGVVEEDGIEQQQQQQQPRATAVPTPANSAVPANSAASAPPRPATHGPAHNSMNNGQAGDAATPPTVSPAIGPKPAPADALVDDDELPGILEILRQRNGPNVVPPAAPVAQQQDRGAGNNIDDGNFQQQPPPPVAQQNINNMNDPAWIFGFRGPVLQFIERFISSAFLTVLVVLDIILVPHIAGSAAAVLPSISELFEQHLRNYMYLNEAAASSPSMLFDGTPMGARGRQHFAMNTTTQVFTVFAGTGVATAFDVLSRIQEHAFDAQTYFTGTVIAFGLFLLLSHLCLHRLKKRGMTRRLTKSEEDALLLSAVLPSAETHLAIPLLDYVVFPIAIGLLACVVLVPTYLSTPTMSSPTLLPEIGAALDMASHVQRDPSVMFTNKMHMYTWQLATGGLFLDIKSGTGGSGTPMRAMTEVIRRKRMSKPAFAEGMRHPLSAGRILWWSLVGARHYRDAVIQDSVARGDNDDQHGIPTTEPNSAIVAFASTSIASTQAFNQSAPVLTRWTAALASYTTVTQMFNALWQLRTAMRYSLEETAAGGRYLSPTVSYAPDIHEATRFFKRFVNELGAPKLWLGVDKKNSGGGSRKNESNTTDTEGPVDEEQSRGTNESPGAVEDGDSPQARNFAGGFVAADALQPDSQEFDRVVSLVPTRSKFYPEEKSWSTLKKYVGTDTLVLIGWLLVAGQLVLVPLGAHVRYMNSGIAARLFGTDFRGSLSRHWLEQGLVHVPKLVMAKTFFWHVIGFVLVWYSAFRLLDRALDGGSWGDESSSASPRDVYPIYLCDELDLSRGVITVFTPFYHLVPRMLLSTGFIHNTFAEYVAPQLGLGEYFSAAVHAAGGDVIGRVLPEIDPARDDFDGLFIYRYYFFNFLYLAAIVAWHSFSIVVLISNLHWHDVLDSFGLGGSVSARCIGFEYVTDQGDTHFRLIIVATFVMLMWSELRSAFRRVVGRVAAVGARIYDDVWIPLVEWWRIRRHRAARNNNAGAEQLPGHQGPNGNSNNRVEPGAAVAAPASSIQADDAQGEQARVRADDDGIDPLLRQQRLRRDERTIAKVRAVSKDLYKHLCIAVSAVVVTVSEEVTENWEPVLEQSEEGEEEACAAEQEVWDRTTAAIRQRVTAKQDETSTPPTAPENQQGSSEASHSNNNNDIGDNRPSEVRRNRDDTYEGKVLAFMGDGTKLVARRKKKVFKKTQYDKLDLSSSRLVEDFSRVQFHISMAEEVLTPMLERLIAHQRRRLVEQHENTRGGRAAAAAAGVDVVPGNVHQAVMMAHYLESLKSNLEVLNQTLVKIPFTAEDVIRLQNDVPGIPYVQLTLSGLLCIGVYWIVLYVALIVCGSDFLVPAGPLAVAAERNGYPGYWLGYTTGWGGIYLIGERVPVVEADTASRVKAVVDCVAWIVQPFTVSRPTSALFSALVVSVAITYITLAANVFPILGHALLMANDGIRRFRFIPFVAKLVLPFVAQVVPWICVRTVVGSLVLAVSSEDGFLSTMVWYRVEGMFVVCVVLITQLLPGLDVIDSVRRKIKDQALLSGIRIHEFNDDDE